MRSGMIGERLGQAAGSHVGIADRLDLLEAAISHQLVEAREQAAQELDHLAGAAGAPRAA